MRLCPEGNPAFRMAPCRLPLLSMSTAKVLDTQDKPKIGMFKVVGRAGLPVRAATVESVCPITGMSEARASELSRAMVEALESVNPRGQRYVRA